MKWVPPNETNEWNSARLKICLVFNVRYVYGEKFGGVRHCDCDWRITLRAFALHCWNIPAA